MMSVYRLNSAGVTFRVSIYLWLPIFILPMTTHGQAASMQDTDITITNNYHFPVNQTIRVIPQGLGWKSFPSEQEGESFNDVQVESDGLWVHVKLDPGASAMYRYGHDSENSSRNTCPSKLKDVFLSGLPKIIHTQDGQDVRLFDLSLVEIANDYKEFHKDASLKRKRIMEFIQSNKSQLRFELQRQASGTLVNTLVYYTEINLVNTYGITVKYETSAFGEVEAAIDLKVLDRQSENAYLALAKFLPATEKEDAAIRWKGAIQDIPWLGQSPGRTIRSHRWDRDVNWLFIKNGDSMSGLMADFTPGMTRLIRNMYHCINDFMVNEVVLGDPRGWHMLSEYSCSNDIGGYVKRDYVIPLPEEIQRTRYRCVRREKCSVQDLDREFIVWAGYQKGQADKHGIAIDLGVGDVEFGTSYFPHATLAENFQYWKTEGLQGEKWWPYHCTAWKTAKEEIRRDMMIANALGMKWIRIHHLDSTVEPKKEPKTDAFMHKREPWLMEYMDFMVQTAQETGLYLYLDVTLSPEQAGEMAEKYGETTPYFEIQNEILLHGIDTDLVPYWKALLEQVKRRSKAKVALTGGPIFLSLFPKLDELGVDNDVIGHHCYIDRRQIPHVFADYALAMGGYATHHNKIPVTSEIGWRFITRDTLAQQAEHFREIFHAYLSQQAVPLVGQFQFQETFCVPPVSRGAVRHYELLHVDRSPKPQARVYRDFIREYSGPQAPINQLRVTIEDKEISPADQVIIPVLFENLTNESLVLQTSLVLPSGLQATGETENQFTLGPHDSYKLERQLAATNDLKPGRYHLFEKVQLANRILCGWGILSNIQSPPLDLEKPLPANVIYELGLEALKSYGLENVKMVVFGKKAPALEIDWALYVYESLRCATGADIARFGDSDPETADLLKTGNVILVGNERSNLVVATLVKKLGIELGGTPAGTGVVKIIANPYAEGSWILMITGANDKGIEKAASDLLYRYWRYAKDAMTFRMGAQTQGQEAKREEKDEMDEDMSWDIQVPDQVKAKETVTIRVFRMTEPPVPAGNMEVWAVFDGKEVLVGTSNPAGELTCVFTESGRYELKLGKNGIFTKIVSVERDN